MNICNNKSLVSIMENPNIIEEIRDDNHNTYINDDNETNSRLNEIIEHIQKPKKIVLPKVYFRPRNTQVDYLDIQDNLNFEPISKNRVETTKEDIEIEPLKTHILEPSEDVKKDAKKNNKNTKEKKRRNPTAYNIFVKETVIKLQETHKNLTPKERFKLAISMWSENKPTKNKE